MVTRIGHMGLRVRDLDAAVAFQRDVMRLTETERIGRVSYLTCNERHHELILVEDAAPGYDHVGLEVADAAALQVVRQRVVHAGGRLLGDVYDGEPGIDRALRFVGPGGHVFKLFCGMEDTGTPTLDDAPRKFEHVSFKVVNMRAMERFLRDALGFRFSDRMGELASWWHCDDDHHGAAVVLAPRSELSHYAWAYHDLNALGRVADRLRDHHQRHLVWGPSRHGPGNNHFIYLMDADGAMIECCSELAQMRDGYDPRDWPMSGRSINQWGPGPPLRFVMAGVRPAAAAHGRPSWVLSPD